MAASDMFIHLIAVDASTGVRALLDHFSHGSLLLKGCPHGWVHRPHRLDKEQLLAHSWDLFLLTREASLPVSTHRLLAAHLSVKVFLPKAQCEQLRSQAGSPPTASANTPPLPQDWVSAGIPLAAIVDTKHSALEPGEWRLDSSMATFLATAFPATIANAPVSLLNRFKYRGSSAIHDDYMEDFKQHFGDAAGATVQCMGPVAGELVYHMKAAAVLLHSLRRTEGKYGAMLTWYNTTASGTMPTCCRQTRTRG